MSITPIPPENCDLGKGDDATVIVASTEDGWVRFEDLPDEIRAEIEAIIGLKPKSKKLS